MFFSDNWPKNEYTSLHQETVKPQVSMADQINSVICNTHTHIMISETVSMLVDFVRQTKLIWKQFENHRLTLLLVPKKKAKKENRLNLIKIDFFFFLSIYYADYLFQNFNKFI